MEQIEENKVSAQHRNLECFSAMEPKKECNGVVRNLLVFFLLFGNHCIYKLLAKELFVTQKRKKRVNLLFNDTRQKDLPKSGSRSFLHS